MVTTITGEEQELRWLRAEPVQVVGVNLSGVSVVEIRATLGTTVQEVSDAFFQSSSELDASKVKLTLLHGSSHRPLEADLELHALGIPTGEALKLLMLVEPNPLGALVGAWVPTHLPWWRSCPVGENEREKYYRYVVGNDGAWVDSRYPTHLGRVHDTGDPNIFEGNAEDDRFGKYKFRWTLQDDGILRMEFGYDLTNLDIPLYFCKRE